MNPFSEDFLEIKHLNYAIYGPHLLSSIDLPIFIKATLVASNLQLKLKGKKRRVKFKYIKNASEYGEPEGRD